MLLGVDDPVPGDARRILVAGVTGAGKSTFCRRLAAASGLPYLELDALHHGPNWEPRAEFRAEVETFTAGSAWITEWQYARKLGDLLESRADLAVWLDLPRRVSWWRLVRRTLSRRMRRTELWNGNVEPPLRYYVTRPEASILRWEQRTHRTWRDRIPTVLAAHPALPIVRLRTPAEVERWLRARE